MTTRVLPRTEWPRLLGTELATVFPVLPEDAEVLVVENGGAIVGCWALYPLLHVEGVWVAPEHRGRGSVFRRLLVGMRALVHGRGREVVQTGALCTDEGAIVATMLQKVGAVELPGRHFAWRM
jgi:hypothetical protein